MLLKRDGAFLDYLLYSAQDHVNGGSVNYYSKKWTLPSKTCVLLHLPINAHVVCGLTHNGMGK